LPPADPCERRPSFRTSRKSSTGYTNGPQANLRKFARNERQSRGSGVTLSYNVREKEEVAALYETALAAGARGIKEPHDIFWGGHIAYAADPDGHVWEFAWNPFSPLGRAGEFQWNGAA